MKIRNNKTDRIIINALIEKLRGKCSGTVLFYFLVVRTLNGTMSVMRQ